jgi:hypothetical protein
MSWLCLTLSISGLGVFGRVTPDDCGLLPFLQYRVLGFRVRVFGRVSHPTTVACSHFCFWISFTLMTNLEDIQYQGLDRLVFSES